jgi:hypothetical protein
MTVIFIGLSELLPVVSDLKDCDFLSSCRIFGLIFSFSYGKDMASVFSEDELYLTFAQIYGIMVILVHFVYIKANPR